VDRASSAIRDPSGDQASSVGQVADRQRRRLAARGGHGEQPVAVQPLTEDLRVVALLLPTLVLLVGFVRRQERDRPRVRGPGEGDDLTLADGNGRGLPAVRVQHVEAGGPTVGAVG